MRLRLSILFLGLAVACSFVGLAAVAQAQTSNAAKPASELLPTYPLAAQKFLECLKKNFGRSYVCSNNSNLNVLDGTNDPGVFDCAAIRSRLSEVREIDFEGLKKILQRDPKDTRPLLINFWATWCDGCREEFPDLVKIDNDYRARGLNFISVSLDDITDIKTAVPQFLKEMKAHMTVVLLNVKDPEPAIHAVDEKWDGALPATYLYDKDGKVVYKYFGAIKPAELRGAIDKAVGTKQ